MPKRPSTAERRAAWARLGATALAVALAFALALALIGRDADELRRTVDGFGGWAPAGFVALGVGLTCAFFPFPVIAAASGVLFGVASGTALSVVAGTLG
ncbi:MAG: hypothetical protein M3P50_09125, partial [Actinomycetota bacterium]|nr:hypothetical protein [Actinomycetota bacterium]